MKTYYCGRIVKAESIQEAIQEVDGQTIELKLCYVDPTVYAVWTGIFIGAIIISIIYTFIPKKT